MFSTYLGIGCWEASKEGPVHIFYPLNPPQNGKLSKTDFFDFVTTRGLTTCPM